MPTHLVEVDVFRVVAPADHMVHGTGYRTLSFRGTRSLWHVFPADGRALMHHVMGDLFIPSGVF